MPIEVIYPIIFEKTVILHIIAPQNVVFMSSGIRMEHICRTSGVPFCGSGGKVGLDAASWLMSDVHNIIFFQGVNNIWVQESLIK